MRVLQDHGRRELRTSHFHLGRITLTPSHRRAEGRYETLLRTADAWTRGNHLMSQPRRVRRGGWISPGASQAASSSRS